MLIGLYVQISAKVILGRSFGLIAANRGIKVAGPYRIVRHPIYAGYTIIHVGFLLALPLIVEPWPLFHSVAGSSGQAFERRAHTQTGSELSRVCRPSAVSACSDDLLEFTAA